MVSILQKTIKFIDMKMQNLKINDVVVRIASEHLGMKIGDMSKIEKVTPGGLHLKDFRGYSKDSNHSVRNLRLATEEEKIKYLNRNDHGGGIFYQALREATALEIKAYKRGVGNISEIAYNKKFNIGDRVRIANLSRGANISFYIGRVGHEGVITGISDSLYYKLEPFCNGGSWPAECLELIEENTHLNYEIY